MMFVCSFFLYRKSKTFPLRQIENARADQPPGKEHQRIEGYLNGKLPPE